MNNFNDLATRILDHPEISESEKRSTIGYLFAVFHDRARLKLWHRNSRAKYRRIVADVMVAPTVLGTGPLP